MTQKLTLGVSLKMYFGYQQTLNWCSEIAAILAEHPLANAQQARFFTFPSTPAIAGAIQHFSGTPMLTGAQNVSSEEPGAWTGETSAAMLTEMGCRMVELGHAERRHHFNETDPLVCKKVLIALRHQLIPVICIGEQHEVSASQACNIAIAQSRLILDSLPADLSKQELIFAWEPQWAIGAPKPASADYIRTVCAGLKHFLVDVSPASRVIYGGSAGPGLLSKLWPDVDGVFLGRFAHQPSAFRQILDEAALL